MTTEIDKAVKRALEQSKDSSSQDDGERHATIAYLALVAETVRPLVGQLTGRIKQPVDRIALSLYVTLIQLAESVKVIAERGPNIAVPTLARQALDAFVDLSNVLTHEHYWKRLEYADDLSWKKELEHASAPGNPFLRLISESGDTLVESRKLHGQRIAEWKRQGISEAKAEERFRLAGMESEYDALWLMLSAYMHNNVSLLMSRHFSVAANEPMQIDLQPARIPYEIACVAHVGEMLMMAAEKVHERFGSGPIDLTALRRATNELAGLSPHDPT